MRSHRSCCTSRMERPEGRPSLTSTCGLRGGFERFARNVCTRVCQPAREVFGDDLLRTELTAVSIIRLGVPDLIPDAGGRIGFSGMRLVSHGRLRGRPHG